MRKPFHHSLILASIIVGGTSPLAPIAMAQTSVLQPTPPQQPSVVVPRRPAAPIVDDVMSLGTPTPEANAAATTPTIARPEVRSGETSPFGGSTSSLEVAGRLLSGVANVLDGNTLSIRGETVVLHGADAFEAGQVCNDQTGMSWDCGGKAARKLGDLIRGRIVECVGVEGLENAITAICSIKGEDLGAVMVSEGYAFVAPGTSGYEPAQRQASLAKRGGWMGSFNFPWVVRSPH